MSTLAYRVMGAAVFDASAYERVEHDRLATGQAFVVVLLSSLSAGVGAAGWEGPRLAALAGVAGVALITWFAWAALILQIGRAYRVPRTHVDFGQLLRTIGFAAGPGVIQVFAVIPFITVPVFIAAWLWMLGAMVVAVRQALDFRSTWRALGVCAVALAIVLSTALAGGIAFERLVS